MKLLYYFLFFAFSLLPLRNLVESPFLDFSPQKIESPVRVKKMKTGNLVGIWKLKDIITLPSATSSDIEAIQFLKDGITWQFYSNKDYTIIMDLFNDNDTIRGIWETIESKRLIVTHAEKESDSFYVERLTGKSLILKIDTDEVIDKFHFYKLK